jgi:ABC-type molybdate transport system substrate-binding protein
MKFDVGGGRARALAAVMRRCAVRATAVLVCGVALAAGAAAAEVRVLVAAAFQPVLMAVVPGFEKRTGHKVTVGHDAAAALVRRIQQGEDFDLAVLPPALLEALAKEGAVSDGSITPLARALGAEPTVYAGAMSTSAADTNAALSLLILLASEETQVLLKDRGLAAP